MANQLDDIFSDNNYDITSTFNFENAEAYEKFLAALEIVHTEGKVIPIEGVVSFSSAMRVSGFSFPLNEDEEITNVHIGPAYDLTEYPIIINGKQKTIKFKRHRTKNTVYLETLNDSVFEIKQKFHLDTEKVNISYNIHYDRAESILDIVDAYRIVQTYLRSLLKIKIEDTNDNNQATQIFDRLRYSSAFWERVLELQDELGIEFIPSTIPDMTDEDQKELDELYLLLCEKKTLRVNQKINPSHVSFNSQPDRREKLTVGSGLGLTFLSHNTYKLLGKEITTYTLNLIFDAIVKEIYDDGDTTKVVYGGTDSRPMYISFRGFKTLEEAEEEGERVEFLETSYKQAPISYEYIKEWY